MKAHSLGLLCFALAAGIAIVGCGSDGGGSGGGGGNERDASSAGGSGGSGGGGGGKGGGPILPEAGDEPTPDDGSDGSETDSLVESDVMPDTEDESITCSPTTETLCGTECCVNATHECKAGVCKIRPCDVGSACGPSMVCKSAEECVPGCIIAGVFYEHDTENPFDPCVACKPASTSGWSPNPGAQCGEGLVCNASKQCVEGCVIGTTHYEINDVNPENSCQHCKKEDQTHWTGKGVLGADCADGAGGKYCNASDACIEGCKIGANVIASGDPNPTNECQLCKSETPTAWSLAEEGKPCGGIVGGACNATGVCSKPPTLAAGAEHTCAISPLGGAYCWGYNQNGQLGDGTVTERLSPTAVSGSGSGIKSIVTGASHSCFLTSTGAVKCWGQGNTGQIGNGAVLAVSNPTQVTGFIDNGIAVTAGGSHTCAVTTDGAAKCWGNNSTGQIGDGSATQRNTPVQVSGLESGVKTIVGGFDHTCAITATGGAKCWGGNYFGQVGNNLSSTDVRLPAQVQGLLTGVESIGAGNYFTCALLSSGGVKCWGNNTFGQLGTNNSEFQKVPTQVYGLESGVVGLAVGLNHACAITNAGAVKCWGYASSGQLGNGAKSDSLKPVDVTDLTSDVVWITAGSYHTCASKLDRTAWCWGAGTYGKLGNGTKTEQLTPFQVTPF